MCQFEDAHLVENNQSFVTPVWPVDKHCNRLRSLLHNNLFVSNLGDKFKPNEKCLVKLIFTILLNYDIDK